MSAAGRLTAVVGAAVLVLAGCSTTDDPDGAEAGALAAAQAYVDAIADQDPETADAMTDPEALELLTGPDGDVDIRSALPAAVEPISDPWVALSSATFDGRYGVVEYVIEVSYGLGGLTGGDTVVVRLEEGADPGDVDSWTVTDPLIGRATTYADQPTVPTARIGTVELTYPSTSNQGVVGYPGTYLLEPVTTRRDIDPLRVPVGAPDLPPWDDSLPKLEPRGRD